MRHQEYRTTTAAKLRGRRVRTSCELGNGIGRVPKGTVLVITGKAGGLRLETLPCSRCGTVWYVNKVDPHNVELLPE